MTDFPLDEVDMSEYEFSKNRDSATITILEKLKKDVKQTAVTLNANEARLLVSLYYMMQEDRKRAGNQVLALGREQKPHALIEWFYDQTEILEKQIKQVLDFYTVNHIMGSWMREIVGIGPVLAAGFLANIDIHKAQTAGAIWRYAGMDPTVTWLGREKAAAKIKEMKQQGLTIDQMIDQISKIIGVNPAHIKQRATTESGDVTIASLTKAASIRPWNSALKVVAWKAGQSFMKLQNNEKCVYGKLYAERKKYEIERNEAMGNKAYAESVVGSFSPSTQAYGWLKEGKIPPAQIDARARRWAVKIFISHLFEEWYRREFKKEPPAPFALAILGHAHKI